MTSWTEQRGVDHAIPAKPRALAVAPDVIIVVMPTKGDRTAVPGRRESIPCCPSISSPTLTWPWLGHGRQHDGCDANAVWSEVCRDINVGVGARLNVKSSRARLRWTVWRRPATSRPAALGLDPNRKIVLMLARTGAVKGPADLFQHAMNQRRA